MSGTSFESPAYPGSPTKWSLEWHAIVHARSRRVMTTLGDALYRRIALRSAFLMKSHNDDHFSPIISLMIHEE